MTESELRYVDKLFEKAKTAQAAFEGSTQEQLDKAARACVKAVYDNAEMFAKEDFDETKMGRYEAKVQRNLNGTKSQWYYTKNKKSTGIIGWEKGKLDTDCIIKIAKPIGIVAAVCPVTNPVQGMASNVMQAVKCGNAVIVCPHPHAKNVANHAGAVIREYLSATGAPVDLVQVVENPSIEYTGEIMKRADAIVATGGPGMVQAAAATGTPSMGVGQGNCQVVIDVGMRDRFDDITAGILSSRTYDGGILCTGEQTVFIPENDKEAFLDAFDTNGAYILSDTMTIDRLRECLFIDRDGRTAPNPAYVGLTAQQLGESIGVEIPENKAAIVVMISDYAEKENLCREKLCPVTAVYPYAGDFKEAVAMAKANLLMEGTGHSSDVYSLDKNNQIYAGIELPVCRLVVNNNNFYAGGGQFNTGMVPTSSLGCGFWGRNTIGENLTFEHLLNYTRMIFTVDGIQDPTDEEIWAE